MLLLHHRRFLKLAAGVGIAPTSRALQTRAHLSMPSSENWCVREELHLRCLPKGPGFTDQGDTSGSRLARMKSGRAGGTCTRDPLLPRQVRWLLRYSPKFVPGHRLHPIPLGPRLQSGPGSCRHENVRKSNAGERKTVGMLPRRSEWRSEPVSSRPRRASPVHLPNGPRGTICTRTGPVLSRMPLLLGYAG